MSTLPIVRFPHPLLKRSTRLVERVDDAIERLIHAMINTMRQHPRCVGLAAPQVGSDLRIAVMDASGHPNASAHHGLLVLINPELNSGEGMVIQREGCLSIPDFTANVRRTARIHLKAFDRDGASRAWW